MRLIIACLLGVVLNGSLCAQDSVKPVVRHRALFQRTEREKAHYRVVEESMEDLGLEQRAVNGSWLGARCDGNDLRLIYAEDVGDRGQERDNFYFDHDSIYFAYYRRGFAAEHYAHWQWYEKRLYFTDGKLIRWLGGDGKPRDLTTDEAHSRGDSVLAEASIYQKLLAGCIAHPPHEKTAEEKNLDRVTHFMFRRYDLLGQIERERNNFELRRSTASLGRLGLVDRSNTGATVEAYCSGQSVRYLVVNNDSLVKYFFVHDSLFEAYRRGSHDDANFYVADDQLYQLERHGMTDETPSEEDKREAVRLIADAHRYLDAMRGCRPRYTLPG